MGIIATVEPYFANTVTIEPGLNMGRSVGAQERYNRSAKRGLVSLVLILTCQEVKINTFF